MTWRVYAVCAKFGVKSRLPGRILENGPGYLVLHKVGPGYLDSQKLWTRLPGKRNVRTRLPRPQFCKSGPGYLADQITWSRPKVGPITWSRPVGRRGRVAGGHASGPLVCPPPRIVARNGRGISDSMATTHMQNGTGQLESKLVEDQVPLRCPTVLPTCHRACPCPPASTR